MSDEMPAGPTITRPPYDPAVALTRVQAAGPRLLKACKEVLFELCGNCRYGLGECTALCGDAGKTNILRAAIAEAEGKAP